ncbi:hypothetical protein Ciccas_008348 [Cichlidogyrus casuarinus]|uniref:Uncharacterized protein n=1 Tax=Cichlidogyrus casuarinus TaxID=1844966 RepID=A0ABD2Q082_9PLAT
MFSKQGFATGIHYDLMSSDKDSEFTGRKEFCCYRILSSLVPKVTMTDDYESYMDTHQIQLKKINEGYNLALEDRKMNFEINNVDLTNEGLNKAFLVLDELLDVEHFERVSYSILEVLRFIFALMLCLIYNQQCLLISDNQLYQDHAKDVRRLNIFDLQAKILVDKLSNCKWKVIMEWLQLVWFVSNVLRAFKNSKVFPGFLKRLIDMEFSKLTGNWHRLFTNSANVIDLKDHPELGRVVFLEPFTDQALDSMSDSYLASTWSILILVFSIYARRKGQE